MGIDFKYGAVSTQYDKFGTEEPVFILRARDALSVEVLNFYAARCHQAGVRIGHINGIGDAKERFCFWQALNGAKLPD